MQAHACKTKQARFAAAFHPPVQRPARPLQQQSVGVFACARAWLMRSSARSTSPKCSMELYWLAPMSAHMRNATGLPAAGAARTAYVALFGESV